MAKRLRIKEGTKAPNTIFEICYKNDDLGDPLINDHHAVALELCTYQELEVMYNLTSKINNILSEIFDKDGTLYLEGLDGVPGNKFTVSSNPESE